MVLLKDVERITVSLILVNNYIHTNSGIKYLFLLFQVDKLAIGTTLLIVDCKVGDVKHKFFFF